MWRRSENAVQEVIRGGTSAGSPRRRSQGGLVFSQTCSLCPALARVGLLPSARRPQISSSRSLYNSEAYARPRYLIRDLHKRDAPPGRVGTLLLSVVQF